MAKKLVKQDLKTLRQVRGKMAQVFVETMNGQMTITKCNALNRTCENIIDTYKEQRKLNEI